MNYTTVLYKKFYAGGTQTEEVTYHLTPDMQPLYAKGKGTIFSAHDRMPDTTPVQTPVKPVVATQEVKEGDLPSGGPAKTEKAVVVAVS